MIGPPMPIPSRAAARLRLPATLGMVVALTAASTGCSQPPESSPTPQATPSASGTPLPTPSPTPTPGPTPTFTNPPDAALVALIPTTILGHPVVIPAVTEFALTPGDIGLIFGELGDRFRALQVAFVERPRLSLYVVHMDAPFAATVDLEPYLAAAGEYVGIAGLHRDPWQLTTIGDHVIWVRPGDSATLPGTMVYTWATGGYVFLMTGVDQAQNLAMLAALPGEPPPSPTPLPSPSAPPSASAPPASSGR
jgi:hypothetical protein